MNEKKQTTEELFSKARRKPKDETFVHFLDLPEEAFQKRLAVLDKEEQESAIRSRKNRMMQKKIELIRAYLSEDMAILKCSCQPEVMSMTDLANGSKKLLGIDGREFTIIGVTPTTDKLIGLIEINSENIGINEYPKSFSFV